MSLFKPGLPARLRAYTFDVVLGGAYPISFAVMPDLSGAVIEVAIRPTGTIGRSGGGLELLFEDLGIALSRAFQRRDAKTGGFGIAGQDSFRLELDMPRQDGGADRVVVDVTLRRREGGRVAAVLLETEGVLRPMLAELAAAMTRELGTIWHHMGPVRRTLVAHGLTHRLDGTEVEVPHVA